MCSSDLASAFEQGTKVAYKAVMRPVEGTILTVIREASWYAHKDAKEDDSMTINTYIDKLIDYATDSLKHTPELLPVLKEVGVVDSGGAGLLCILKGFKAALDGTPVKPETNKSTSATSITNMEHDEFGYCTEFIVRLADDKIETFNEDRLKDLLGDRKSVV